MDTVSTGQRVDLVIIYYGRDVDAIALEVTKPSGVKCTMRRGGHGGKERRLDLSPGEVITKPEAHYGKVKKSIRIVYIKFTTNKKHILYCGIPTRYIGKDVAPEGFELGGFHGASGAAVDAVGAIGLQMLRERL